MKNRFNLNEEEKNRIRTLHGIKPINEQEQKTQIQVDIEDRPLPPSQGEEGERIVTEEEIEELIGLAQNKIEDLLLNKSINLYNADRGKDEGELIRVNGEEDVNPFIVDNVEVTTTSPYLGGLPIRRYGDKPGGAEDVYVLLRLRNGGGDGHLTLNLMWYCMTSAFKTDAEGYRNFGVKDIMNKKLLDILNKLCYTPGPVSDLHGILSSDTKIVPDADFVSNDQEGDNTDSIT
jgi:hypothetical protein